MTTNVTWARLGFAVAILLCWTSPALGQEHCTPFGGTLYGWHDGKAWIGEGDFLVGKQVLHAKVVDVNNTLEKHGETWWGTETATFTFTAGDKVQLITEFTTEHMTNAAGVFHVNENGTFANGTGRFRTASGHFTSQGPFGPAVVLPRGKEPPTKMAMYWIGHYSGTICGVGK
jgi:hypothetical protein